MKMEILASWMNQDSFILAEESRIAGNVLVINQCNQYGIAEMMHDPSRWRMILTKDRGLSRSRNLALDNAEAEICLLCDDDEIFADGYEAIIEESFRKLPEADIIGFNVEGKETRLEQKIQRIGKWKSFLLYSWHFGENRLKNMGFALMNAWVPEAVMDQGRRTSFCWMQFGKG